MSIDPPLVPRHGLVERRGHAWRRVDAGGSDEGLAVGDRSASIDDSERVLEAWGRVLDERQQVLDEREHVLALREARLRVMEKRQVERKRVDRDVLTRAVQRDIMAQGRDFAAAKRDIAADLDAWLRGDVDRPAAEARQEALDDRKHAHDDRCSAAADRSSLHG